MSGTGKNSGGQVDLFDTFPVERQNFSVISTPGFFAALPLDYDLTIGSLS